MSSAGTDRIRRLAWIRRSASVLLLWGLAGCGDSELRDVVGLEAVETRSALEFRAELFSVPGAVERWGRGMAVEGLAEAWHGSWDLPIDEGRRRRTEVHRALAPMLAPEVDPAELRRAGETLDRAVTAAEELLATGLPPHLVPPLERARRERDALLGELEAGSPERALRHLLAASDELRQVTPEEIARSIVNEGESLLSRLQSPPGASEAAAAETEARVQRAARLLTGARDALETGSPTLALRRGWYALRLLEEAGP